MIIPAEIQLATAIVLIYLLDCLTLLYVNEGVVERRGSGWRIGFGSTQPWIAGKRVCLLNPFTPLTDACKASWQIRDVFDGRIAAESAKARLDHRSAILRKLSPYVVMVWVLVLIALPVALCVWNTLGFLCIAALAWLSIWALVLKFWQLRSALDLSRGEFLLIVLECLACPPCAANLVRKLSMRTPLGADLAAFAGILGDRDAAIGAFARIDHEVKVRLVFLEPETPEYERAVQYRTMLAAERERLGDDADRMIDGKKESQ